MEINIRQIQNELLPLSGKANILFQRLIAEREDIQGSLTKAQSYFSDQYNGRVLSMELSQAMREIQYACRELEQLKAAIVEYIGVLAK